MSVTDPSTLSNYSVFRTYDLKLDIDVSFDSKTLTITSQHFFKVLKTPESQTLVLDTESLTVDSVQIKNLDGRSDFTSAQFELSETTKYLGRGLSIDLTGLGSLNEASRFLVCIRSRTTEEPREGLQWMSKEETAGKKHPYLYSQCQSIFCRSIFPCQDTPALKFTFSASVKVPEGLAVVMSAISNGPGISSGDGKTVFSFTQSQPIPAYLFAIAVGNLVKSDLGPRCAVWTEPELLDACVYEFAEVESILKIAESICGPYVWTRYEFLVLPPTFPFGGMENANMTFLSPTLLAGDRSMISVLAHEIEHSWTGNLVTTASWEHFWLNEGWTRFIEDKIKARMEGNESYRKFLLVKEQKRLRDDIANFEETGRSELTALVPDLSNRSPEDAFCAVPYEKGCMLLCYVEELVGGPEAFAPYIKNYVETFRNTPVDSQAWLKHLIGFFPNKAEALNALPWEDIFSKFGGSVVNIDTTNELTEKCKEVCEKWTCARSKEDFDAIYREFPDAAVWSSDVKAEVLEMLREKDNKWSVEKFESFTKHLGVEGTKNCEQLTPWIRIGLRCEIERAIDVAEDLLVNCNIGRLKYVGPIYRALYRWEQKGRPRAVAIFTRLKPIMNPIAVNEVAKILQLTA